VKIVVYGPERRTGALCDGTIVDLCGAFAKYAWEKEGDPRAMALAVHPYISGVPHRIKYFEAVYDYMRKKPGVWMTTGEEIYEWYKQSRR